MLRGQTMLTKSQVEFADWFTSFSISENLWTQTTSEH